MSLTVEAQPTTTGRASVPPPRIVRPAGIAKASKPIELPDPEHSHLPGWVRRVLGQAAPVLGDLLSELKGPARVQLMLEVTVLGKQVSSGKFSQAWHYQTVIDRGAKLLCQQRRVQLHVLRFRQSVSQPL